MQPDRAIRLDDAERALEEALLSYEPHEHVLVFLCARAYDWNAALRRLGRTGLPSDPGRVSAIRQSVSSHIKDALR
jgi:hypothetical protein